MSYCAIFVYLLDFSVGDGDRKKLNRKEMNIA